MKIGVYPGSFNPFHVGHFDVLQKASKLFDKIIILKKTNETTLIQMGNNYEQISGEKIIYNDPNSVFINSTLGKTKIVFHSFNCLFYKRIKELEELHGEFSGVIRGLRNGNDLQYEMNLQYTNEDLGINVPFVYFITDRKISHISSSTIREINSFEKNKNLPGKD